MNATERALEILGLDVHATPEQVKHAHKTRVKTWQPDRFLDSRARRRAEERVKQINWAREHLRGHDPRPRPRPSPPHAYAQPFRPAEERWPKAEAKVPPWPIIMGIILLLRAIAVLFENARW